MNRKQKRVLIMGAVIGAVVAIAVPAAKVIVPVSINHSLLPKLPAGDFYGQAYAYVNPKAVVLTFVAAATLATVFAMRSRK